MMKRFALLLSLILVSGCEKRTPPFIVGTWALLDYTYINLEKGEKVKATTDVKTWKFLESGLGYVNGSDPITYTQKEKVLTITYLNSGKKSRYEIEDLTYSYLKVYWHTPPSQYYKGSDSWYTFIKIEE